MEMSGRPGWMCGLQLRTEVWIENNDLRAVVSQWARAQKKTDGVNYEEHIKQHRELRQADNRRH